MRLSKPFLLLFVLVACAFASPLSVSAQEIPPDSIRINFTEVSEDEKALSLGVYFTLMNSGSGQPVTDARIQSVELTQLDNNVHTPASFKPADTPFYIVLLLDASGSMQRAAQDMRKAASEALNDAPKGAQFAVVKFDQEIEVLHDFSNDPTAVTRSIEKVVPEEGKGTCLYDATYTAIEMLAKTPPGRRTVILFTDGKDELSNGKPCSEHSYDEVVDFANKSEMHVPINTIGLSGSQSAINATELNAMASNTGGFSAIGSQGTLSSMFKQIIDALNSQWLAQADLFPLKGTHDAAIRVTLDDGKTISAAFNFTASKDYATPPAPVQVKVDGLEFRPEQKAYLLHLSFVSPQLIERLRIAVWDEDTGLKLSENSYNNLTSQATFDISFEGMQAGKDYIIRIDPYGPQNAAFLDPNGDPISLEHKLKYDPTIKQTSLNIASVAIQEAEIIAKVEAIHGDQVVKYNGWLVNEETNALVPGSEFSVDRLENGNQLSIPMKDIPAGKYKVILKAIGNEELLLADASYEGVVYAPPAKPSAIAALFAQIGWGLRANPWILIIVLVVLLGGIGAVVWITIRRRETGTPILQGSMEAVLGPGHTNPPVSQTMMIEKPASQKPAAAPRSDQPLVMLRVMASPDPSVKGNAYIVNKLPFTLGRIDSDLNIPMDAKVSRKHAEIAYDVASRRYLITDVGSSNGLFLNGARIPVNQPAWLAAGTIIQLGPDTQIVFEQK